MKVKNKIRKFYLKIGDSYIIYDEHIKPFIKDIENILLELKKLNLKLPKIIEFREKMKRLGLCSQEKNRIAIKSGIDFPNMAFIILHELIHYNYYNHHKKKFWKKFYKICKKLNMNPLNYINNISHYRRAKLYYNKYFLK